MAATNSDGTKPSVLRRLGSVAAVIVAIACLVVVWTQLMARTPSDDANERVYMCMETGKTFSHVLVVGEIEPILSPHSGKKTAYRAEPCYWTKDNGRKKDPTWVVVKSRINFEDTSETTCPDCGHPVYPHNKEKNNPWKTANSDGR